MYINIAAITIAADIPTTITNNTSATPVNQSHRSRHVSVLPFEQFSNPPLSPLIPPILLPPLHAAMAIIAFTTAPWVLIFSPLLLLMLLMSQSFPTLSTTNVSLRPKHQSPPVSLHLVPLLLHLLLLLLHHLLLSFIQPLFSQQQTITILIMTPTCKHSFQPFLFVVNRHLLLMSFQIVSNDFGRPLVNEVLSKF